VLEAWHPNAAHLEDLHLTEPVRAQSAASFPLTSQNATGFRLRRSRGGSVVRRGSATLVAVRALQKARQAAHADTLLHELMLLTVLEARATRPRQAWSGRWRLTKGCLPGSIMPRERYSGNGPDSQRRARQSRRLVPALAVKQNAAKLAGDCEPQRD